MHLATAVDSSATPQGGNLHYAVASGWQAGRADSRRGQGLVAARRPIPLTAEVCTRETLPTGASTKGPNGTMEGAARGVLHLPRPGGFIHRALHRPCAPVRGGGAHAVRFCGSDCGSDDPMAWRGRESLLRSAPREQGSGFAAHLRLRRVGQSSAVAEGISLRFTTTPTCATAPGATAHVRARQGRPRVWVARTSQGTNTRGEEGSLWQGHDGEGEAREDRREGLHRGRTKEDVLRSF